MKTHIILVFFSLLSLFSLQAQLPFTSQLFTSRIFLNPAFTGIDHVSRFSASTRAYNVSLKEKSLLWSTSHEQMFGKSGSHRAVGVMVQRGVINSQERLDIGATLSYAQEFQLSENQVLRAGISGSFKQRSLEFFDLQFPDQINPRDSVIAPVPWEEVTTLARPDIDLGFLYTNKNFFLSASFHNLINPDYPFVSPRGFIPIEINRRINFMAGGRIGLYTFENVFGKDWELEVRPYTLLALQKNYQQVALGVQNYFGPLMLGYLYKSYGQHVIQTGLSLGPVSLGYSYDYTKFGAQGLFYYRTHELSLQVLIPSQKKGKKNPHLPSF